MKKSQSSIHGTTNLENELYNDDNNDGTKKTKTINNIEMFVFVQ